MSELLNCPFCGGVAQSIPYTGVQAGEPVRCANAECAIGYVWIKAGAWNRRAIAPDEGRKWLPIESAPNNHLPILLYGPYGAIVGFRDINWDWFPCPAYKELAYTPTHWQPLPTPPDAGEG